jgi:hypothetical protein
MERKGRKREGLRGEESGDRTQRWQARTVGEIGGVRRRGMIM